MTKNEKLVAEIISDGREFFSNNLAHAQFASDAAKRLAAERPKFDRPAFIMAAMPKAWVGSNKANPWERIARGDRY